jgi:hypothetical protein
MHPLFYTIPESQIWCEPNYPTRIVWATLLYLADDDADNSVSLTLPELAELAGVTDAETAAAIARLLAPDPYNNYSRSENGAHIETIPEGWRVFPSVYVSEVKCHSQN